MMILVSNISFVVKFSNSLDVLQIKNLSLLVNDVVMQSRDIRCCIALSKEALLLPNLELIPLTFVFVFVFKRT